MLPALLFGSTVLVLAIVQGLRGQTQAWPIACYPTFAAIIGGTLPDLFVDVETENRGRVRFTGRERGPRTQAEWGRVFRISGVYGSPLDAQALRRHALDSAERARVSLAPGSTVHVSRRLRDRAGALASSAERSAPVEPLSRRAVTTIGLPLRHPLLDAEG